MLPNFEKLNVQFNKAIGNAVRKISKSRGALREVRSYVIHEGARTEIRRPDDSVEETEMVTAEAEIKLTFDEIEDVTFELIVDRVMSMGTQFGNQQSKLFFKTMDEVTTRTGQVHSTGGRPLTNEDMLLMLEKMQIDFERDPVHGDFSIVVAPSMVSTLQKLSEEMDSSPSPRKRWAEILERKRDEYRGREADRNLAG